MICSLAFLTGEKVAMAAPTMEGDSERSVLAVKVCSAVSPSAKSVYVKSTALFWLSVRLASKRNQSAGW